MARKRRLAADGTPLLTPSQERLLGYLASETARTGGVLATKAGLAQTIGCGVKTVDKAVTCLKDRGLVEVEPRFGADGAQLPSEYRVVIARSIAQETIAAESSAPAQFEKAL